jgi:hypothetical protein
LQEFSFGEGLFSSSPPEVMSYVLFILDNLTGREQLVNRFFISEQEANRYCVENNLIFSRVISEKQYQVLVQNHQNQKLMKQFYQRPQPQQYQQNRTVIHEEFEEEEIPQMRKPPKPVFVKNFNPGQAPYRPVFPAFVLNRRKK